MKTGVMYDLMIYDFSKRFDNAKVYVADSGKISSSTDKKYLVFTMYSGVSFENLRDVNRYPRDEKVPYLRESFSMKEILIAFDANFKMEDESHMQNRDLSKNLKQLGSYIDSASVVADSLDNQVVKMLKKGFYSQALFSPSQVEKEQEQSQSEESKDLYTYYDEKTDVQKQSVLTSAKSKAATVRSELYYNKDMQTGRNAPLIGHKIEWHKKIAISFACLVFLFIGAPLGAIIRKGGIGMPTVVSVFLFLFYYSIDMLGLKLAKQDVVPVWLGMWLSPIVLFSLGLFFTYKAVNDSIMFNVDAWMALFKRLIGKKETRNYQKKEVIMYSPDYTGCLNKLRKLTTDSEDFQKQINKNPGYISFWNKDIFAPVDRISQDMENLIDELRNSEYNLIIAKLMDYPVFSAMQTSLMRNKKIRTICAYVFPIGIVVYLYNLYKIKGVKEDIALLIRVNGELSVEIEKKINKD